MDELEKEKNKRKIYISLLVSVICIVGVSYAFFTMYLRQADNNSMTALSCFTSTLTEENSALNLENEFPISDENGMKKTPFTFKVTNNCDNYVKVYITIDPLKEGTANYILSKYIKANVSSKDTTDGESLIVGNQSTKVLENKDNGFIVKEVTLAPNGSKEFDLRLWIDYDTTKEQAAGMIYLNQVVIVTEPNQPTFAETILANNEVKTPLTTPGIEPSAHTKDDIIYTKTKSVSSTEQAYYFTYGTGYEASGVKLKLTGTAVTSNTYTNSYSDLVGKYLPSLYDSSSNSAGTMTNTTNLSSIYYVVSATQDSFIYKEIISNKNTTEALLASTEDNYGRSYYFRGAVKNNYVQFANKCWRIVRINGDGSVKLILHNDNTSNSSSPCSSSNNSTTAAFAHYDGNTYKSEFNSNYEDNAYIGFMYGTTGSSDYESTHANTNKSTILINLETWYENNLIQYEDKLADTIWCNDKSIENDTLGYGTEYTEYAAYNRLISKNMSTLKCSNNNNGGKLSKFTVSDKVNGNGALTYKIGLITLDETIFAGNYDVYLGTYNYLWENTGGQIYWSATPLFKHADVNIFAVNSLRILYGAEGDPAGFAYGLRPAISLISNLEVTGSGTSEDPYIVD